MNSLRILEIAPAPEETGMRLDALLARRVAELGRRGAARLFREGDVTVSGRRVKKSERAREGAVIRIVLGAGLGPEPEPEPDQLLSIALERDDLAIVSKPGGQPCAAARPGDRGTLAGAVLARWPETAEVGHRALEPGLVHRLDTGTSGLLVIARTHLAFDRASAALVRGGFEKRYLAVVRAEGIPEHGEVRQALAPSEKSKKRVVVVASAARSAHAVVTRWRVAEVRGAWALLEVEVSRAYRHQIRVHLASIGHPIAGDTLYGGPDAPALGDDRHALHACRVAWSGDDVIRGFDVVDPMPADMATFFEGL